MGGEGCLQAATSTSTLFSCSVLTAVPRWKSSKAKPFCFEKEEIDLIMFHLSLILKVFK